MNIPPIPMPATHALQEPIRPSQQAPQEIARPVAAPSPAEAASQEARRKEERQQERGGRDTTGRRSHTDEEQRVAQQHAAMAAQAQREITGSRQTDYAASRESAQSEDVGHLVDVFV